MFFLLAVLVFAVGSETVFAEWNSSNLADFNLPDRTVDAILLTILEWLLSIVGILGVLGFVVAGITYLTSYGDDKALEKAKKMMLYSVVGVVVALIGLIVVTAISGIFIDNDGDAFTLFFQKERVDGFSRQQLI